MRRLARSDREAANPPAEDTAAGRIGVEGKAEITVRGASPVDAPASPERALEKFTFDGGGPHVVSIRQADGTIVEFTDATELTLYPDVVIVRLENGSGRLVRRADFLGARWESPSAN